MRRSLICLSVFAVALIANYGPLLNTHPEQDSCTFGPVSNSEYREYRTRAAALVPVFAPSLYRSGDSFALQLDEVFQNLSKNERSIYKRLAIVHAVMRAAGAEYRNTNEYGPDGGRSDPFVRATTDTTTVSFNYVLDLNRLWVFFPWPRDAWIIGVLAGPRYVRPPGPLNPSGVGEASFIVHPPDLKTWPAGFEVRRDEPCPPVPNADIADSFLPKPQ